MFSKAVIIFLAIGALWVNVLAIPMPARPSPSALATIPEEDRESPSTPMHDDSLLSPPIPAHKIPSSSGSSNPTNNYPPTNQNPPVPGPSVPNRPRPPVKGNRLLSFVKGNWRYEGELPRSFSALSYRDLTSSSQWLRREWGGSLPPPISAPSIRITPRASLSRNPRIRITLPSLLSSNRSPCLKTRPRIPFPPPLSTSRSQLLPLGEEPH